MYLRDMYLIVGIGERLEGGKVERTNERRRHLLRSKNMGHSLRVFFIFLLLLPSRAHFLPWKETAQKRGGGEKSEGRDSEKMGTPEQKGKGLRPV